MRAPEMDRPIRHRPGDPQALRPGRRAEAVAGTGELEMDGRAAPRHPGDVADMVARRLRPHQPGLDRHAPLAQERVAASRDPGIRILDRADHPGDAGGQDRLGAGRRAAVMGAGLQGDVEGRAAGGLAGGRERQRLPVRAPARRGRPRPEDAPRIRLDHDGAHRRVRPRGAEAAPAQRQGEAHEGRVVAHDAGLMGARTGDGAAPRAPARATARYRAPECRRRASRAASRNPWPRENSCRPRRSARRRRRRGP
jgi:hypothetical protein